MKISLIFTILNEEKSILELLTSIKKQTLLPDEIIIVDGGSTDSTRDIIEKFSQENKQLNIRCLIKKGNRSVGRNFAIKSAKNPIIAITDAGCILEKNWLKFISRHFENKSIDVVAGNTLPLSKSIFQQCLAPYVLVMQDRINEKDYLPAGRSMALRKNVWKKVGGFNEKTNSSEDYDISRRLKNKGFNLSFEKKAIVYWRPRKNIMSAFKMFYVYAFGDVEAKIYRPKVFLIFLRYIYFLNFIFLLALYRNLLSLIFVTGFILTYLIWSILKNYRYVKNLQAVVLLPALQITSDIAVMSGFIFGSLRNLLNSNFRKLFKKNKILFFVLFIYSLLVFSSFYWGAPNKNHLYPYHMDEWHQFKSVVNTFSQGTPNAEGSAHGTMFHFSTVGVYLTPFAATHILNKSMTIEDYSQKERLFILLRLNTFLFGFFSVVAIFILFKKLKLNPLLLIFFIFSPVFFVLSGYFKYDIALQFWIILSILFSYRFAKDPSPPNLFIAGIFPAVSISVKISALPLLPIYFLTFILFSKKWRSDLKYFLLGIFNSIFLIIFLGIPDTVFGKGNIYSYLYDNIINVPHGVSSTLNIGENQYVYLFISQYPFIFGYGLMIMFVISVVLILSKYKKINREIIFAMLSYLLFVLSLYPLGLVGTGNRSLILLPYILLISGFGIALIKNKKTAVIIILLFITLQFFQVLGWLRVKHSVDPQSASSIWIVKNIPAEETIGIENIPIYQRLPDIIEKEYDLLPYQPKNKYNYEIIDKNSTKFPKYVILSNANFDNTHLLDSPKQLIIKKLRQENYKVIYSSGPDLSLMKLGGEKDYYFSALLPSPVSITIYRK